MCIRDRFITASNSLYRRSMDYNVLMAKKRGGFDKVLAYDFETMIEMCIRDRAAADQPVG